MLMQCDFGITQELDAFLQATGWASRREIQRKLANRHYIKLLQSTQHSVLDANPDPHLGQAIGVSFVRSVMNDGNSTSG